MLCSFQFETESEGTKLRRDVLAEGNVGLGPSTTGLVAILSGQEEMFAFRRAVCTGSCYWSVLLVLQAIGLQFLSLLRRFDNLDVPLLYFKFRVRRQ